VDVEFREVDGIFGDRRCLSCELEEKTFNGVRRSSTIPYPKALLAAFSI